MHKNEYEEIVVVNIKYISKNWKYSSKVEENELDN